MFEKTRNSLLFLNSKVVLGKPTQPLFWCGSLKKKIAVVFLIEKYHNIVTMLDQG